MDTSFRFAADARHPDDSVYADGLILSDAHGRHWSRGELGKRPERSIVQRPDAGRLDRRARRHGTPSMRFAIEAPLR